MELNKVYNCDCVEYMRTLPNECVDLIIADPPYYKAINEKWDKQWKTEDEYLNWTQQWFNECVRVLKPTEVFYCYGNFDILSKQKVLIFDKQLNFRQNITLSKGLRAIAGRTSDKLRMFPTASEYLLYYVKQDEFFDTPFSRIMKQKMKELNLTQSDISKLELSKNGKPTGWVHNKLKGIQVPTEKQWIKICKLFNIRNEYNTLIEQYKNERYIFNLPVGVTDVWDFIPDKVRYGHKTQKPQDVTDRIINASSNPNDLVYIPFAGSGSEIISCVKYNRNYIATEINNKYIENIIYKRLENVSNNN